LRGSRLDVSLIDSRPNLSKDDDDTHSNMSNSDDDGHPNVPEQGVSAYIWKRTLNAHQIRVSSV
jgi:hypothetical protein